MRRRRRGVHVNVNVHEHDVSFGALCLLPPARAAIQKGTRVLISLWDSLMFGRVPGTHQNISEPHTEIRTQVPFCIKGGRPLTRSGKSTPSKRRRSPFNSTRQCFAALYTLRGNTSLPFKLCKAILRVPLRSTKEAAHLHFLLHTLELFAMALCERDR